LYRFGDLSGEAGCLTVEPNQNTLVAFPSWARHEVRRVDCSSRTFADYRFAVNIWLCRTRSSSQPAS
jgi:Rps23 Pro-64 3,4-dihydroxylase Tpa1-like proline 4-hydroxylase